MELAPSLHRLGGSTLVNSYLVADASGVTLIDAGLPGYWNQLPAELAAMGRSIDDVRGVVLTHGDTDHVGFAERLCGRERGVPVYVHAADAGARSRRSDQTDVRVGADEGQRAIRVPLVLGSERRPAHPAGRRGRRRRDGVRRSTCPARQGDPYARATRREASGSTSRRSTPSSSGIASRRGTC